MMNTNVISENAEFKAASFAEAILPIIEQYILAKVKLNQLNEKWVKSKEPLDSLNGILNFCEQTIINEMRNIKIETNEVDKTN